MESAAPRRYLYPLLAFGLAALLLEGGAFVLLSLASGRWMTTGALAAARSAASSVPGDGAAGTAAPDGRAAEIPFLGRTIVHPYLGYVREPESAEHFDPEAMAYGFTQKTGIFHEPSPERIFVAVLGGSVARFMAVKNDDLRDALMATPRFAGREVIVVSLAAGGYKAPQQLMALNYFLALGAHFDLVINLDGFNDVVLPLIWNVPRDVFPFYPQRWELQVGELSLEQRRRIGELTWLRQRRAAAARSFSLPPWRYSFTAATLWTVFDRRWEREIARVEGALRASRADGERDPQGWGPEKSWDDREALLRDLVGVWRRTSVQLDALCRGLGIEYHHFLQPNQYVPGSKPLSEEELRTAVRKRTLYRDAVEEGYPRLILAGHELRERGVSFHDLTGIFEGNTATLYRDACCHLSFAGNELLAQAVAEVVGAAGSGDSDRP